MVFLFNANEVRWRLDDAGFGWTIMNRPPGEPILEVRDISDPFNARFWVRTPVNLWILTQSGYTRLAPVPLRGEMPRPSTVDDVWHEPSRAYFNE